MWHLSEPAFYDLTLGEVADRLDAVLWQQRRDRERDAWMLLHIVSPWVSKRLRLTDFLPGEGTVPAHEKAAFVDQQIAKWEARRA